MRATQARPTPKLAADDVSLGMQGDCFIPKLLHAPRANTRPQAAMKAGVAGLWLVLNAGEAMKLVGRGEDTKKIKDKNSSQPTPRALKTASICSTSTHVCFPQHCYLCPPLNSAPTPSS